MTDFLRGYEITVQGGEDMWFKSFPQSTQTDVVNPPYATPNYLYKPLIQDVGYQVTFSENQIKAAIKYSSSSSKSLANSNTIEVVNPSDKVIEICSQRDAVISLKAGYLLGNNGDVRDVKDLPLVFEGDIVSCKLYRNNTGTVLRITCTENMQLKTTSTTSQKFKKGTLLEDMFRKIVKDAGFGIDIDLGSKKKDTLERDITVSGMTSSSIEGLALSYGLEWYNLNKKVVIRYGSVTEERALEIYEGDIKGTVDWTLTQDTNSKRSLPNKTNDINQNLPTGWSVTSKPSYNSSLGKEITFTTFLNPKITLGRQISLVKDGPTSSMVVKSVTHKLDYFGSSWDTVVVAEAGNV